MPHPLAIELAPIMDRDLGELRRIVAQWVIEEKDLEERARYREFGAELSKLQHRIQARPVPPTEEEIEIAITALLVIAGHRVRRGRG